MNKIEINIRWCGRYCSIYIAVYNHHSIDNLEIESSNSVQLDDDLLSAFQCAELIPEDAASFFDYVTSKRINLTIVNEYNLSLIHI